MISQVTIERVRDLDIVQVIGHYMDIKNKGANYVALSPFTEEKTPSFVVSPTRQIFKCFSSGIGGDAITFVMESRNLGFADAVRDIASKNSVSMEYDNDPEATKEQTKAREQLYSINHATAKRYGSELMKVDGTHDAFRELIDRRRYTADTILQWRLGYAPGRSEKYDPKEWQFLTKPLVENGYYQQGTDLGLIKTKEGRNYDAFRHRVMFPIQDDKGRYVGFGGRSLEHRKEAPKYINSPQSPIYNKSGLLYGLNHASTAIRKLGYAYLTEGYTDVMLC